MENASLSPTRIHQRFGRGNCENVGDGPASKKTFAMISEQSRKWLPDVNNPNHVIMIIRVGRITPRLCQRFKEWILTDPFAANNAPARCYSSFDPLLGKLG